MKSAASFLAGSAFGGLAFIAIASLAVLNFLLSELYVFRHLVRGAGVQGAQVVGRGYRGSGDPELAARPEDADGDLSAVRDEQLSDRHDGHSTVRLVGVGPRV